MHCMLISHSANVDYDSIMETLMFDSSTSRQCEDIPITDDDILENDEQFTVTLTTSDDGVELDPERGTVVIEDSTGTYIHIHIQSKKYPYKLNVYMWMYIVSLVSGLMLPLFFVQRL